MSHVQSRAAVQTAKQILIRKNSVKRFIKRLDMLISHGREKKATLSPAKCFLRLAMEG